MSEAIEKIKKKALQQSMQKCLELIAQKKDADTRKKEPASGSESPVEIAMGKLNLATMANAELPPQSRAEMLILAANEVGFDIQAPVAALLARLDQFVALEKKLAAVTEQLAEAKKEADGHPLRTEIFLRYLERGDAPRAAIVLSGQGAPQVYPMEKGVDGLVCGDALFVDMKTGLVVGRDPSLPTTGEIIRIEEVSADGTQATVKKRDESYTAHLAQRVQGHPDLRAGAQAVWDPVRHLIHRIVTPQLDGRDLLTPADSLTSFTLADLGNPNPVIFEIVDQVKQAVAHPGWTRDLDVSRRRSYLFWGPTGTGKSSSIRAIVNLIADWTEELTGKREPRVVFADASDFYSPWFGEGEQKITRWFDKIYELAGEERRTRDGGHIRLPLVVVLEEIEGLIRRRGDSGGSSHLFERMLGLILQKMDSAERDTDTPVVFITTSNRKELADAAARRRFGDREILFPYLDAGGTYSILSKKLPEGLPFVGEQETVGGHPGARQQAVREILFHLFGDGEDQAIAEVVHRDARRTTICRRDIVSGAILESAVERAKDRAMRKSVQADQLVGLDVADVIEALEDRYTELAQGLTPGNIQEHVPQLFEGQSAPQIASVTPVPRRPRAAS